MPVIGILGGMGPQASARLVDLIISKTPDFVDSPIDSDFPEIIHLSAPVPNFIANKYNMKKAKEILLKRTQFLEDAGSTINGIACNTAHLLLPELQASTVVPFLSIPNLVSEQIKAAGFKRVGLLATPTTLGSRIYDEALKDICELLKPDSSTVKKLEAFIFRQLSGKITATQRNQFRKLVDDFKNQQNLDCVVLGCTELPLVFGNNDDAAIIDSLDVLADGLLDHVYL